jgi:Holliday junction DNA helicase RuvA
MISRIKGILREKRDSSVLIEVHGICYEVFIPEVIMKAIDDKIGNDNSVDLVTYHYYQVDPARNIPVLIGFFNEIEKEFFESFITVSGVGPRAAIKALRLPISTIAKAIDQGDLALLKSLPGIGTQRAKEIIAKLQGKVGKFALIQDKVTQERYAVEENIHQEALAVLVQLQYRKTEAKEMIHKALARNSRVKTVEELLNEVYRQRAEGG